MQVEDKLRHLAHRAAVKVGLARPQVNLADFVLSNAEAASLKADPKTEILAQFFKEEGRPVYKWVHYPPIYDSYFSKYRGTSVTFLEIGVLDGGSLDFWRRYFGSDATIVGIDVDPACAERVSAPNHVRIGSQADPVFLEKLAAEFGPFDVVLDDGSHVGHHQRASFEALFPHVKAGGIYAIEDTHTSYWPDHGGGFRRPSSAIELGKAIVDDMHGWYHHHVEREWVRSQIPAVHFYDSVIVIEKDQHDRFGMMKGGGTA